jgi:uncharacterized membrane protein
MAPLIVLLSTFFALLFIPVTRKRFGTGRAGVISMGVMLLFTAIGHFKYLKGMALMIPPFFPFPELITIATGIFEILAGVLLIAGKLNRIVVWMVLLFFIAILPANIYAGLHHVNLQKADFTGPGPEYLWFRIPLQLFFIAWLWYFYRKLRS